MVVVGRLQGGDARGRHEFCLEGIGGSGKRMGMGRRVRGGVVLVL